MSRYQLGFFKLLQFEIKDGFTHLLRTKFCAEKNFVTESFSELDLSSFRKIYVETQSCCRVCEYNV